MRKQATLRPVAAAEAAQQALAAVLAEAEGWGVGGRAPILLLSHDGVAEEAPLYLPSISPISPLYLPYISPSCSRTTAWRRRRSCLGLGLGLGLGLVVRVT